MGIWDEQQVELQFVLFLQIFSLNYSQLCSVLLSDHGHLDKTVTAAVFVTGQPSSLQKCR